MRGEIDSSGMMTWQDYTVEAVDAAKGGVVGTTRAQAGGAFQLDVDASKSYQFRVRNSQGELVDSALVTGGDNNVQIIVPKNGTSRLSGTVTAARLTHQPTKAATKAFERGMKARENGKWTEAEKQFQQALASDSDYFDALNELGRVYVAKGDFVRAFDTFTKCVEADPEFVAAQMNRATAALRLNRFEDVRVAASKALAIRPDLTYARYLRGLALREMGRPKEALADIHSVSTPKARLVEASLLVDLGRVRDAIPQVEQYLSAKPDGNTEPIIQWLNRLKRNAEGPGL
jgi:tetratricopeptide (TPR) repeat protein